MKKVAGRYTINVQTYNPGSQLGKVLGPRPYIQPCDITLNLTRRCILTVTL